MPLPRQSLKGDWNDVKALTNQTIAVKTKSGDMHFGIVRFADDSEIRVQIAAKEDLKSQEDVFRRDHIEKVWMATLRFGERSTGRGALIGAGAGLGAAILTALVKRGSDDPPVGIGAFPVYGAGVGAVVGRFKKERSQETEVNLQCLTHSYVICDDRIQSRD